MAEIIINEFPGGKFKPGQYLRFVLSIYPALRNAYLRRGLSSLDAHRFALYGTYQAAYESGYGTNTQSDRYNYGGLSTTKDYGSYDGYANAYTDLIMRNWPNALKAPSFLNYILELHKKGTNGGIYSTTPPNTYIKGASGTLNRVNSHLKLLTGGGLDYNQTDALKGFEDAKKFILENLNSPGFRNRLRKNINNIDTEHTSQGEEILKNFDLYLKNFKVSPGLNNAFAVIPGSKYKNFPSVESETSKEYFKKHPEFVGWSYTLTHELGHLIDRLLGKGPNQYYSSEPSLINVFNKSGQYKWVNHKLKQALKSSTSKTLNNNVKDYVDWATTPNATKFNKQHHDGQPKESYADVWDLRKRLFDSGVYDSKSITPITLKLLLKYKEIVPLENWGRIFKYFKDNDIIYMLNNLAYNNNNNIDIT